MNHNPLGAEPFYWLLTFDRISCSKVIYPDLKQDDVQPSVVGVGEECAHVT